MKARVGGAIAGTTGAAVALGVSELVSGAWPEAPSLVLAVGQTVIRMAPDAMARWGIDTVGANDKPLVVVGTVALALLIGALLGVGSATRRTALLPVGFAAFGLLGVRAVASSDGDRSVTAAAASASIAIAAGIAAARALQASARPMTPVTTSLPIGEAVHRRRFIVVSAASLAGAGATALAGRKLATRVDDGRAAIALPSPVDPAPPATPAVAGAVTPWATPNAAFYRIDEALVVPRIDVGSWRLRVSGLVERPFALSYEALLGRPLVERWSTLVCVSNEVGGDLVGNARWLGVPLRELIVEAGVDDVADQVVGRAVDGFTAGFPLAVALDGRDALVAVGMNGEPLPAAHGFPARLVVPGLYGYVSATKWLTEIEVTTVDATTPYWVSRGWARDGDVKQQVRIDVPRTGTVLPPGRAVVAGVAWAPTAGIRNVEVRIDEGAWRPATLGRVPSADTWVQWHARWDAEPGLHTLRARCVDHEGNVQPGRRSATFPDGAEGWHAVRVEVTRSSGATS